MLEYAMFEKGRMFMVLYAVTRGLGVSLVFFVFLFLLDFVCLFWVYRPNREFFIHMETSPLPMKGCKFGPMFGTHGH